jgi:hypothetical protein
LEKRGNQIHERDLQRVIGVMTNKDRWYSSSVYLTNEPLRVPRNLQRLSLSIKNLLLSPFLHIYMHFSILFKEQPRIPQRLTKEITLLRIWLLLIPTLYIHISQGIEPCIQPRRVVNSYKSVPSPVLVFLCHERCGR